ncbi:hypothetical protein TMatcc_001063 [Talaromyces marneffei ATCC 18224]|uniref:Meiotically up-regulated gene 154 protein n=2 Tax=Talaromyces marneffei TaxID=37727 RepID=B6QPI0_TALMQ|nr:uncharacterized protein EYB26_003582 [Talaromyces marneffei]EEA21053.1 conserved hypothetical protein [Talaromyces marneffei ATCC 18224]KAE8549995.1 hypothetical protein EYB25_008520 [Talaromyces marneffei]QGA15921.1 hypothetical protein EYB26_003582 [Talaromyces marneffei]
MPRLVRRQPLSERLANFFNPWDFLLWISEEIESSDWAQLEKDWAQPLGFGLNFVFLIARANVATGTSRADYDIFGDDRSRLSVLSWAATFIVHTLTLFSSANAFYTFWRKRRYRLFEASIDRTLATPSAQRVKVSSNPMSTSPINYIRNILAGETAESRRHPDPKRDVWEIAVWDPFPLSLRLFCSFSPGHVLVYWLFLPTLPTDPRPSVTIFTTIVLAILLTVQMSFLSSSFSQQSKDLAVVHKEVMHEYDTKFVHPRTQPLMRDVGVQFSEEHVKNAGSDERYNQVELWTPTHIINRGFKTSPNPNYLAHVDPESTGRQVSPSRRQSFMPTNSQAGVQLQTPSHLRDSSPVVQNQLSNIRQPQFRPPTTSTGTGDGGSLGVYSHANSPFRKSMSTNFIEERQRSTPSFNDRLAALTSAKRASSPLKRTNTPGGVSASSVAQPRWGHLNDTHRRESGRF